MRRPGLPVSVNRHNEGGAASFYSLFARVAPRTLLYIRARLGPALAARVEAVDVLQETYLQAYRDLGEFRLREPGAFTGWLCRIADHRLRDLADHFGAEKRRAQEEAVRGSAVLERLRRDAPGPGTEVGLREEQDALLEALARLEADAREALLLRFFHELTLEEVATRLSTSEPTVRRLLARAQVHLGRHLRSLQP